MVSEHQDLTAVLQILYVALAEYGCPEAIVSDNGSVFTAGAYWNWPHESLHIWEARSPHPSHRV